MGRKPQVCLVATVYLPKVATLVSLEYIGVQKLIPWFCFSLITVIYMLC